MRASRAKARPRMRARSEGILTGVLFDVVGRAGRVMEDEIRLVRLDDSSIEAVRADVGRGGDV